VLKGALVAMQGEEDSEVIHIDVRDVGELADLHNDADAGEVLLDDADAGEDAKEEVVADEDGMLKPLVVAGGCENVCAGRMPGKRARRLQRQHARDAAEKGVVPVPANSVDRVCWADVFDDVQEIFVPAREDKDFVEEAADTLESVNSVASVHSFLSAVAVPTVESPAVRMPEVEVKGPAGERGELQLGQLQLAPRSIV
jgi:hypothetical protein